MTVAVSCNLPDGVILGVDSAVTINDGKGGIAKVYENAEKLFQLGEKPIGIATYGLGALGTRSIGSYVREFELTYPAKVAGKKVQLKDLVEDLRSFFLDAYSKIVIPAIIASGRKYEEIPDEQKPLLGFVVGGFSDGAYLSEVWEIQIPLNSKIGSSKLRRQQGNFGSDWFALGGPVTRYIKGYDPNLLDELLTYVDSLRGTKLAPNEVQMVQQILSKYEFQIPFAAMPIEEGIAYVKSIVGMVINHHRFSVGASVVGGAARIGKVTYKGEKFEIIQ